MSGFATRQEGRDGKQRMLGLSVFASIASLAVVMLAAVLLANVVIHTLAATAASLWLSAVAAASGPCLVLPAFASVMASVVLFATLATHTLPATGALIVAACASSSNAAASG
jgi:hypothetical protein